MARETKGVFLVPSWVDVLGRLASRHRGRMIQLGRLETRLFSAELAELPIDRPIFIAGLARAGTTILLEAIESHPDTASHRYRDFPMVLTPIFWNRFLDRTPQRDEEPKERAHRDGIEVTADSPEAFEEIVWMAFFPELHEVPAKDVLDRQSRNPEFEAFFRDHVRKLLWLRGGRRYLSKANYNVTRLEYLLRLFPDARIVLPVRDPVWHIASLMKQHRLFCAGERQEPRALQHLQRAGHFEFGLDRRPITAGDPQEVGRIVELWQNGRELEGWARYWSHVNGFVAERLAADPQLREAALVVRFEDLWQAPQRTLRRLFDHCELTCGEDFIDGFAGRIRAPSYYAPDFGAEELAIISDCTAETALRFGYPDPARTSGFLAERGAGVTAASAAERPL